MNGHTIQELQEVNELIDATYADLAQKESELKDAYTPAFVVSSFFITAVVMFAKNQNFVFIAFLVLALLLTVHMAYSLYRKNLVIRVIKSSLHDIQWVKKSILES